MTPRQLDPAEQDRLVEYGLGLTNLVDRATARADELTGAELRAGAGVLLGKLRHREVRWLAVVGITAYRVAFGAPKAATGEQPGSFGGAGVWVLPNPSGLNAHYDLDGLAAAFSELRRSSR